MSRARAGVAAVVAALAVGSVAACGGSDVGGAASIVAGFYPLQFVAERVGGSEVRVSNLTQPGAEPHDLELSPRQVGAISDATLVLYLHGFQPAVDEAVAQAGSTALDVSSVVPLLPAATSHEDEEGATDPHVWLDPDRLGTIADALAQRLAELDPEGAAGYRDRATGLRRELTALDGELAAGLGECGRREIVVSHAAFGYLADRYGLRQIPITGLSPDTEPTPGQLAEAAEEARAVGATTIFFETLVSPAVAQAVANEVGAGTAMLDPIEGLEPGAGDDYLSVMRTNLATLRTALGCS